MTDKAIFNFDPQNYSAEDLYEQLINLLNNHKDQINIILEEFTKLPFFDLNFAKTHQLPSNFIYPVSVNGCLKEEIEKEEFCGWFNCKREKKGLTCDRHKVFANVRKQYFKWSQADYLSKRDIKKFYQKILQLVRMENLRKTLYFKRDEAICIILKEFSRKSYIGESFFLKYPLPIGAIRNSKYKQCENINGWPLEIISPLYAWIAKRTPKKFSKLSEGNLIYGLKYCQDVHYELVKHEKITQTLICQIRPYLEDVYGFVCLNFCFQHSLPCETFYEMILEEREEKEEAYQRIKRYIREFSNDLDNDMMMLHRMKYW